LAFLTVLAPLSLTILAPFLTILAPALFTVTPFVFGENTFSLPNAILPEGTTGSHIFVRCVHDVEIRGYSLSLSYDPLDLAVTEVTTAGTSAEHAEYSYSQTPARSLTGSSWT
jgi:hypothetical protein